MTTTVDQAAAALLIQLNAPPGSVNTIGVTEGRKKVIRVLVDKNFWYRLPGVPTRFKGFPVRVEKRDATIAGDSCASSLH